MTTATRSAARKTSSNKVSLANICKLLECRPHDVSWVETEGGYFEFSILGGWKARIDLDGMWIVLAYQAKDDASGVGIGELVKLVRKHYAAARKMEETRRG